MENSRDGVYLARYLSYYLRLEKSEEYAGDQKS